MNNPNPLNQVSWLTPVEPTGITAQLFFNKGLEIKWLSPVMPPLTGSIEKATCCPICSIIANFKQQTIETDAENVIETGRLIIRELETTDGKWYQVITLPAIRQTNDSIEGAIVAFSEITERKLDEVRKSDFIAMVSHELKTPLTSVQGYVQIVIAKARKSGDSFTAIALEKANTQLKKMNSLINGFLNVAQLDAGKINLNKTLFEIKALITEITDEAIFADPDRNIERSLCSPTTLLADREKIAQVISNLLGNAIKYASPGTRIQISCHTDAHAIQVTVTDEGRGISPRDKEKLFDRYYRVDNASGQNISGFGLGLYLSAEIIKRHQGEIWAESELGKGSAFTFKLPRF